METPDLSAVLGLTPPPGVIPNFIDPPTREALPKITAYVTLPPTVLFLALRFYARLRFTTLGVDDLAIQLVPINGTSQLAVNKYELAATYTYFVAAIFIKVSILVFYRRIFGFARYANVLIWIGVTFTVILYTAIISIFIYFCVPHHEDYSSSGFFSSESLQRCMGVSGWTIFVTGVVSVVIDAYILAIPLGFLTQLNTSIRRRASLCTLFAVGFSALVFSIIGAVYRSKFLFGELDGSWSSMYVYATQIGEINLGIVSSCMPIVFTIFKGYSVKATSWVNSRWLSTRGRAQLPTFTRAVNSVQTPRVYEQGRLGIPQIPSPTLTGLKSVMRSFISNSQTRTGPKLEILTDTSYKNAYHTQLREEYQRSSSQRQS
ncbi:hypothetical protein RRF57_006640 [Xylaria bambusicola]|uniref:Rhodopsin domain-containing protein n=1 Tax=Xylaria bambusicola TaxID=326684 RepID=A0AAN7UER3_9PEZI